MGLQGGRRQKCFSALQWKCIIQGKTFQLYKTNSTLRMEMAYKKPLLLGVLETVTIQFLDINSAIGSMGPTFAMFQQNL